MRAVGKVARLALVASLAATASCAQPPARPAIDHIVLVSLRDPALAAELVAECERDLSTIPGVVAVRAGMPLDDKRIQTLSDYDVGCVIGFASREAYEAYREHPAHEALVARWKDRLAGVRVIDVEQVGGVPP